MGTGTANPFLASAVKKMTKHPTLKQLRREMITAAIVLGVVMLGALLFEVIF
jgi:hypothetical protein